MLLWFAEHPEERAWVLERPAERWSPAIEELLRYFTPAPMGARFTTEDMILAGWSIPAGSKVEGVTSSANLDPAVFDDPLRVDLARTPNRHVAFASGYHRCLGSHLARMELRVALEEFHRLIPDARVARDSTPVRDNQVVRRVIHLPLEWDPGGQGD